MHLISCFSNGTPCIWLQNCWSKTDHLFFNGRQWLLENCEGSHDSDVGQHATLERGPASICAKIGSSLLIRTSNLDTKIINLSIKWQFNVQINNCVPLCLADGTESTFCWYFVYRYRKCQSKRLHLHDFCWILIKEDLVFTNQGNGLKRKRNVNVVFKATEGSEVNQSAAGEYPSLTGSTGAQAIPAAFPWLLCLPRVRVWWHMDPFCTNTQQALHSTQHLLWAWRLQNTCVLPLGSQTEELQGIIFEWKIWWNPSVQQQLVHNNDQNIITNIFSVGINPRFNGIVELKTLQCVNLVFLTLPPFCLIQASRFIKILYNYSFDQ